MNTYKKIWQFHDVNRNHYFLPLNDILWIESSFETNIVHTLVDTYPIHALLKDILTQLPPCFIKIHRSIIVNSHHVRILGRYYVILTGGTKLPVPQKKYAMVKESLNNILMHIE